MKRSGTKWWQNVTQTAKIIGTGMDWPAQTLILRLFGCIQRSEASLFAVSKPLCALITNEKHCFIAIGSENRSPGMYWTWGACLCPFLILFGCSIMSKKIIQKPKLFWITITATCSHSLCVQDNCTVTICHHTVTWIILKYLESINQYKSYDCIYTVYICIWSDIYIYIHSSSSKHQPTPPQT